MGTLNIVLYFLLGTLNIVFNKIPFQTPSLPVLDHAKEQHQCTVVYSLSEVLRNHNLTPTSLVERKTFPTDDALKDVCVILILIIKLKKANEKLSINVIAEKFTLSILV